MSADMSPYCSAHVEWLIMKLCMYVGYHDANNVSTFGGDAVTKLNFKTRFKKVMRDLQRRSSILLESARDRVTSASKTACDRVTDMERPACKTVQLLLDLLILQTCRYAHHLCTIPSNGHTSLSRALVTILSDNRHLAE